MRDEGAVSATGAREHHEEISLMIAELAQVIKDAAACREEVSTAASLLAVAYAMNEGKAEELCNLIRPFMLAEADRERAEAN